MSGDLIIQLVIASVMLSLTYALIAIGMTIIFGIMDIINFAHGDFFMLGAYVTFFLLGTLHINFFVTLVIATAVLGLLGLIVEKLAFYRLRQDALFGLILALGLSTVLQSGAQLTLGTDVRYISPPYRAMFNVLGVSFSLERVLPAVIALVITIGTILFIQYTSAGRTMRAVAQDPSAALLQGISISRTRVLTFVIASGLAGGAGALIATLQPITPHMGMNPLMKGFAIIIVGGMGSISGAVVGSFFIGFLDGFLATFIGSTGASLLAFGLFIAILIVRPRGLLGHG